MRAEAQRLTLTFNFTPFMFEWKARNMIPYSNCTGCMWCHCRYSLRIHHNGVALNCCFAESSGPARGIGRAVLTNPHTLYEDTRQIQRILIESIWKKRQVAYQVCLRNPSSLWWFLSLPLSTAHQWVSLCSHPALRVNSSKLHKLALVTDRA